MHIDGDSFFAACEVAKDPTLRGKPVVTGKERGIVSAMTYEAKRAGIKRGIPLHEVKKICPEAIILPSDYETYSLFSNRMYSIVRRYTPIVEEYSIDECFADLTGLRRKYQGSYEKLVTKVKKDLETELGMTFSIGLSATKVLAKVGSRWKKPDGLTVIPLSEAHTFLKKVNIQQVWGIGPNTAAYLQKFGIQTAWDFVRRDEKWVRGAVSKPYYEIWQELSGKSVYEVEENGRETYQSISKTKTFTPPLRDERFIFSQLSKNIENACIKARRWGLATPSIFFFLKTQGFKYHGCEVSLSHATCVPQEILRAVAEHFPKVFRKGELYRATGITLMRLEDANKTQLDLFGSVLKSKSVQGVFESIDAICERYGKHTVFLASSFEAMTHSAHAGDRGEVPVRVERMFRGETARKRLSIAYLGEVS